MILKWSMFIVNSLLIAGVLYFIYLVYVSERFPTTDSLELIDQVLRIKFTSIFILILIPLRSYLKKITQKKGNPSKD